MANGDFSTNGLDRDRYSVKLLDAQSATVTDVMWVEIPPAFNVRSFWCDITAEASGSPLVNIYVSNADTKPASATTGILIRSLAPATPYATAVESYRWVKAGKTAGGTPVAVTCILEASRS